MAGDLAEEALRDLVGQFTDRYAFVRELIQNALDAGSGRIDVEMTYDLDEGELVVAVIDDGEGMDRETIEGYLLTLFRSTKEEDLTKIGKFGIGFVSLFAMGPREVVVDTGRDMVWHRVVFHEDRSYTLIEKADPYEGTTVALHIPCTPEEASEHCRELRASAARWCRFADAEISTSADGIEDGWPLTDIAVDFTVHCPVVVAHEADGFHAVVGASSSAFSGFYSHGLTLWEGDVGMLPGVRFRVKGRHLEHTLTRDNVRRDKHFDAVMKRLEVMARDELGPRLHEVLSTTEHPERDFRDLPHTEVSWKWERRRGLVPAVGRDRVSIKELAALGPGMLDRALGRDERRELLCGTGAFAERVAAADHLVLAGMPSDAHVRWAAGWMQGVPVDVRTRFRAPEPVDTPQLLLDAEALSEALDRPLQLLACHFLSSGMKGRLALAQNEPYAVEKADADEATSTLIVVDIRHDLYRRIAAFEHDVAVPLLLRAVELDARQGYRLDPRLVQAVLGALGS